MADYLPILCLLVLAVLFAALSFVASTLFAPRRSTPAKEAPYECGIVPTREPSERFPVRFYLIAMIFIIFDIEIIFIYPWATMFKVSGFGFFGLIEMFVFVAAAFVALVYLVSLGALNWGPAKRLQTFVDPTRTSASTVVRVPNAEQAA